MLVVRGWVDSYFISIPNRNSVFAEPLIRFCHGFTGFKIEALYFLSCPGSFTQKLQTRSDAGILKKTIDGNAFTEFLPSILRDQLFQYFLEGFPVQWVIWVRVHSRSIYRSEFDVPYVCSIFGLSY